MVKNKGCAMRQVLIYPGEDNVELSVKLIECG